MERAILCPQCNAPLTPHQFARSIVCSYCGASIRLDEAPVSTAKFRDAFDVWNSPETTQISAWVSILNKGQEYSSGNTHWALDKWLAHGEFSDVYFARRARWPTELVTLKLLRDSNAADLFENEWSALQILQRSQAPGANSFTRLIPQPVAHGSISSGLHAGPRQVSIFRWASGFLHNFDEVMRAYPQGIAPQASVWIWRRILEVLSFIHASGMAHGAVLPANLLIQENEHGVRLVGYSRAGKLGNRLPVISQATESFYPQAVQSNPKLSVQLDLALSARCVVAILGGDPKTAVLPASVPVKLAAIIQRIALSDCADQVNQDAWALHEELGVISSQVFGPARFIPVVMPS